MKTENISAGGAQEKPQLANLWSLNIGVVCTRSAAYDWGYLIVGGGTLGANLTDYGG